MTTTPILATDSLSISGESEDDGVNDAESVHDDDGMDAENEDSEED